MRTDVDDFNDAVDSAVKWADKIVADQNQRLRARVQELNGSLLSSRDDNKRLKGELQEQIDQKRQARRDARKYQRECVDCEERLHRAQVGPDGKSPVITIDGVEYRIAMPPLDPEKSYPNVPQVHVGGGAAGGPPQGAAVNPGPDGLARVNNELIRIEQESRQGLVNLQSSIDGVCERLSNVQKALADRLKCVPSSSRIEDIEHDVASFDKRIVTEFNSRTALGQRLQEQLNTAVSRLDSAEHDIAAVQRRWVDLAKTVDERINNVLCKVDDALSQISGHYGWLRSHENGIVELAKHTGWDKVPENAAAVRRIVAKHEAAERRLQADLADHDPDDRSYLAEEPPPGPDFDIHDKEVK